MDRNRAASRSFGVPETCVRDWRKQKQNIVDSKDSRKGFSGPQQGRFPQIEELLGEYCKHLLQIGGRGLREIGVNAMKAVLAHDVQVLYSLHGRKGKRAFVNLRLCRLVTDVICQKAGCDQAEALNFIKRWLPGSGDRCGGRKRHFREAFVVEQPCSTTKGCSRQLASCPATAARALTAPLSLCPQRNLTCSIAGLF
ncbi:hypothetical protein HPB51_005673 [Rhipicephalus microplus]|uniref:Uncharacterized protein n=1 Tax=Rhipicephalus microplus TaxID=6941 RepID=A0A9J6EYG2_RHIMP|nr:hypothetical protein HPB51_005673 [Rhipicephalus microplus]